MTIYMSTEEFIKKALKAIPMSISPDDRKRLKAFIIDLVLQFIAEDEEKEKMRNAAD